MGIMRPEIGCKLVEGVSGGGKVGGMDRGGLGCEGLQSEGLEVTERREGGGELICPSSWEGSTMQLYLY